MEEVANAENPNEEEQFVQNNIPDSPYRRESSSSSSSSNSSISSASSSSTSGSFNPMNSITNSTSATPPLSVASDGKSYCGTKMISCSQTWTIENFVQFLTDDYCGQYPKIFSSKFTTFNRWKGLEFCLDIRPRGESFNDREYVALFLLSEGNSKRMINAEMSVIDGNGKKQQTKSCLREDSASAADYGWYRFVSHKELKDKRNNLLPDGKLTVHVEVSILLTDTVVKEESLRELLNKEESGLADDLETFFETGEFADVKLCVGRRVLNVHKFILQSRSPVFAAMFKNDMKEKNNNRVVIKEMTFVTLELLVRYLYCGRIDDEELRVNCYNLYRAADMYQLDNLKKICEKAIFIELDDRPRLSRQVLTISKMHNIPKLYDKTMLIVRKRAIDAIKTLGSESMEEVYDFIDNIVNKTNETASTSGMPSTSAGASTSASISAPSVAKKNPKPKRSRRS